MHTSMLFWRTMEVNIFEFKRLQKRILSWFREGTSQVPSFLSRSVRLKLAEGSKWRVNAVNPVRRQSWIGWQGRLPLSGRWDPIIRQTRTPPPGFHSSSVYHMALSSWAPLTDNERRQPVKLQAKHSTFYRPKHVSGKLTVSIQFCSAFKRPITITFSLLAPAFLQCLRSQTEQNKWLLGASFWIQRKLHLTELRAARKRKRMTLLCDTLFPQDY